MNFRYLFPVFLILVGLESKSQTLLNLRLTAVSEILINAKLLSKTTQNAKFKYPVPPQGNDCIFSTKCFFNAEHKCFKYVNEYWGNKLAIEEINRLKKYYPNLKSTNKYHWNDNKQKFEITLTKSNTKGILWLLTIQKI